MSSTLAKIRMEEEELLCRTYSRYPLDIVRGQNARLWDSAGREYVDLLAGIAVAGLGHCNPELNASLFGQAETLWHVSNLFYQQPQLDLAQRLLSTCKAGKAFFCNSGAEANEACIKLARRYMRKVRGCDAYEIISLGDCFHGRTMGALTATGRDALCDGFHPLPRGFRQIPAEDLDALKGAISPATAAVILECIQGEAGVRPLSAEYLRQVQKLCRERDILLICDEVQCGLGRSGKFWAFEHAGLEPDMISTAKALANGLPMGAMLTSDEVARGFEPGSHATTFGGGALCSAVASKVIEILVRDNIPARAERLGTELLLRLKKLAAEFPQKIREVRGQGLMIGIELHNAQAEYPKKIWEALLRAGFICNLSHATTLRLLPPLTIAEDDLWNFSKAFRQILCAE